jgi:hypothetical protein
MTYKRSDWQIALTRLTEARKIYERYKDPEREWRDPNELDDAILKTWTFGEYAINVFLECSDALEKLNRYRKKASHLGYARERSTHYSAADVLRGITEMESLRDEVSAKLKERGKL